MFGVLIHRHDSKYDDHPSARYQFPKSYLSRAAPLERGWVLFYEPTKVTNSRGYYAIAKIESIVRDPTDSEMYLALMEPGSYFEFPDPVPFKNASGLLERGLYNEDGNISGRAQSAVRPISQADFDRILDKGLQKIVAPLPRVDRAKANNFGEDAADFDHSESRKRQAYSGNRLVRDPMFRKLILDAYEERCSFTGMRLINGGGRAEVQAAHIRPVEANGPDSVQNGIALSGTIHWMFDRGLLSLADDMQILVSRQVNDQQSIKKLVHESLVATVPSDSRKAPHPAFLRWHRENCFKA